MMITAEPPTETIYDLDKAPFDLDAPAPILIWDVDFDIINPTDTNIEYLVWLNEEDVYEFANIYRYNLRNADNLVPFRMPLEDALKLATHEKFIRLVIIDGKGNSIDEYDLQ